MQPRPVIVAAAAAAVLALAPPLPAQTPLEDPPLVGRTGVGLPWQLEVRPDFRFTRAAGAAGLVATPSFDLALGLPAWMLAGARYTPQSPVVAGHADEWELYGRFQAFAEQRGQFADVTFGYAYNGAARSLDVEATAARWLGPLRVLGGLRQFTDMFGTGRSRGALAGGATWFPHPRGAPIAFSADVVQPLDDDARTAWSAALNIGVSFTTHTLALFVTNTPSATMQGTTLGTTRTLFGLRFTAPIATGQLFRLVASREQALRAVDEGPRPGAPPAEPPPAGVDVSAEMFRYAFVENRIEVVRGATIEWTNRDAVVHTVAADDGSWNSGSLQAAEQWRATFNEPGIYPFHCGPHPFMKGVVVVR